MSARDVVLQFTSDLRSELGIDLPGSAAEALETMIEEACAEAAEVGEDAIRYAMADAEARADAAEVALADIFEAAVAATIGKPGAAQFIVDALQGAGGGANLSAGAARILAAVRPSDYYAGARQAHADR